MALGLMGLLLAQTQTAQPSATVTGQQGVPRFDASWRTVLDDAEATAVVQLEFGLNHAAPRHWSGKVALTAGEVLTLWGWHFTRPDRIEGGDGWDFHTRAFNPEDATYRPARELPNDKTVLPNGVYISLRAAEHSTVSVTTNHGSFSFVLSELRGAGRLSFLGGDVNAVLTPPVRALTRGEASQHDFPAATFVGGDLFVAWTTFHNEANALYLARRSGKQWTTQRVTPEWGDYYGTAISSDDKGVVHVIWSEYRGGRWRLLDRAYDPGSDRWQNVRYIAPEGDRQYFPQATRDASGRPWVVWQEFKENNLDVMASFFAEGRWSEPLRISTSDANDWSPSIAAAPDGSVWFAWDSYEAGNYDVLVRAFRGGRLEAPIQLTQAPSRDAYASIAVDSQNRVWVAWAEAGPKWGKDWGVLGRPGTQLRQDSRIRLVRLVNGRWSEPAQAMEGAVPGWMGDRHEYPRLVIGANDVPYVFFRKVMGRLPILEHALLLKFGEDERLLQPWYDTVNTMSSIHVMGFDGKRWLASRQVPLSEGGAFAQFAAASRPDGATIVWPSDGRSYVDPHFRTSQLRFADFPLADKLEGEGSMGEFASIAVGDDDVIVEQRDMARVRAVRWDAAEPLRLFRGDLHRHTDFSADSQNDGDILYQYRYALDAGALDFLAVTDHSGAERLPFYKYTWWRTRQIATMFNRPGRFVTFFGYERTITYPGGHRNVISTRRDLQPVPISDEEFSGAESWAERLYPALIAGGDIAIAHTTASGAGTDWRDGDPRAEPVVEIFQGARGSYEEAGSPAQAGGSTGYEAGFVWNAWAKGRKIGVISSSDHNSTHQSYACVYAPALTPEAIHQAIKQRLTYASTDNIIVQVEAIGADGVAHKMGSEVTTSALPRLEIRIEGTEVIAKLELIRNGEVIHSLSPGSSSARFSYVDNAPLAGESYYNVRLVQQNRQIAWSSPIWIRHNAKD